MAAPLLSAVTAAADSDPKLIPETLTSDEGRKALGLPRAPPSTLAAGKGTAGSGWLGSPSGAGAGNAACLMMG